MKNTKELIELTLSAKYGPPPTGRFLGTLEKIELKRINSERQKIQAEIIAIDCHVQELGGENPDVSFVAQSLWLTLRSRFNLPSGKDYSSGELRDVHGVIGALATGVKKSFLCGEPKIEIHGTVCPSYPDGDDWKEMEPTGVYVYQQVHEEKIKHVGDFIDSLLSSCGAVISAVALHTSAPEDRKSSFSKSFGIFSERKMKNGIDSLKLHWDQMSDIADRFQAVKLQPDLAYIDQRMTKVQTDQLIETDLGVANAYERFVRSEYVESAYTQWGCEPASVFGGLYLGTVAGYGNPERAFSIESDAPVKLQLNFESGDSPQTFAGKRIGVDFRHLLKGYHLALLAADWALQSPWAMKGKGKGTDE